MVNKKEGESRALFTRRVMEQLKRLELLIGDKIEQVKKTTVLILGLGGVGGYAVESLARSGIGKLIIVDSDNIDITNLNRQIISNHENIGHKKVDEWEKRIKCINLEIIVEKITDFITIDNINILFDKKFDYLIDACDTITTKKEVIKRCLQKGIPFISSMGTGKKLHPEYLEITTLDKTSYDPIAKKLRKMLKDEHIYGKVPVVYSKEQAPKIDSTTVASSAFVPSVAGLLCASYIFNLIVR